MLHFPFCIHFASVRAVGPGLKLSGCRRSACVHRPRTDRTKKCGCVQHYIILLDLSTAASPLRPDFFRFRTIWVASSMPDIFWSVRADLYKLGAPKHVVLMLKFFFCTTTAEKSCAILSLPSCKAGRTMRTLCRRVTAIFCPYFFWPAKNTICAGPVDTSATNVCRHITCLYHSTSPAQYPYLTLDM